MPRLSQAALPEVAKAIAGNIRKKWTASGEAGTPFQENSITMSAEQQAPAASGHMELGLGAALVAVLVLIALVDAAIETFWSGSPIRWWVSASVLVFVALSVWLWRPGGTAAKRWGWPGAAHWSVGGLLALLAVTAWLPEGQVNGVRMALQPTSTVLTAAIALAVLLAAYVLVRGLGFLPKTARLVARAVVILLAIYALAALGVAIRDHATFASLFQGGALWQRLPRWLQGTFVGALGLLPLAILAQVARFAETLRRHEPVRILIQQTTALVMTVVVALSGVMLPVGSRGRVAAPSADFGVTAASATLDRSRSDLAVLLMRLNPDKPLSPEQEADRVAALFAAADEAVAALPHDTFDVAAVVRTVGADPVRLFEWVRDRTYWVPYHGTLRGPFGVLMDRLGNSLDRSLLLLALLKTAGATGRLAHARLSPQLARLLVDQVRPVPDEPVSESGRSLAAEDAVLAKYGARLAIAEAPLRAKLEEAQRAAQQMTSRGAERAERQASLLLAAVGPRPAAAEDRGEQAAADHWWVQVSDRGTWVDFDPAVPSAHPGTTITPASESMRPEDLPRAFWHEIEIRVVIERSVADRRDEQIALAHTLRLSELVGRSVTLQQLPLSLKPPGDSLKLGSTLPYLTQSLKSEREWLPVLRVGKKLHTGKVITTSGELEDLSAAGGSAVDIGAAKPASDIGGFLGGGETPKAGQGNEPGPASRQPGRLTAEWIEYEIRVPGAQARTVRREIFDDIGPAARADLAKNRSTQTDTQELERALAMFVHTEILPIGCRLSPDFVIWLRSEAMKANRTIVTTVLRKAGRMSSKEALELVAKAEDIPGAVYDLALTRQALNPAGSDVYLATPNILSLHEGLSVVAPGTTKGFRAFDIVANEVAIRVGSKRQPFETRLRQGTHDTNAEALVLSAECCGAPVSGASTAPWLTGESEAGWTTVSQANQLSQLRLTDEARARIAADITAGYLTVAPAAGPDGAVSWWRIDPTTGQTLGMGRRGWGTATTEKSLLEQMRALAHMPAFQMGIKLELLTMCVAATLVPLPAKAQDPGNCEKVSSAECEAVGKDKFDQSNELLLGLHVCLIGAMFGGLSMMGGAGAWGKLLLWTGMVIDVLGMYLEYHKFHLYHPK